MKVRDVLLLLVISFVSARSDFGDGSLERRMEGSGARKNPMLPPSPRPPAQQNPNAATLSKPAPLPTRSPDLRRSSPTNLPSAGPSTEPVADTTQSKGKKRDRSRLATTSQGSRRSDSNKESSPDINDRAGRAKSRRLDAEKTQKAAKVKKLPEKTASINRLSDQSLRADNSRRDRLDSTPGVGDLGVGNINQGFQTMPALPRLQPSFGLDSPIVQQNIARPSRTSSPQSGRRRSSTNLLLDSNAQVSPFLGPMLPGSYPLSRERSASPRQYGAGDQFSLDQSSLRLGSPQSWLDPSLRSPTFGQLAMQRGRSSSPSEPDEFGDLGNLLRFPTPPDSPNSRSRDRNSLLHSDRSTSPARTGVRGSFPNDLYGLSSYLDSRLNRPTGRNSPLQKSRSTSPAQLDRQGGLSGNLFGFPSSSDIQLGHSTGGGSLLQKERSTSPTHIRNQGMLAGNPIDLTSFGLPTPYLGFDLQNPAFATSNSPPRLAPFNQFSNQERPIGSPILKYPPSPREISRSVSPPSGSPKNQKIPSDPLLQQNFLPLLSSPTRSNSPGPASLRYAAQERPYSDTMHRNYLASSDFPTSMTLLSKDPANINLVSGIWPPSHLQNIQEPMVNNPSLQRQGSWESIELSRLRQAGSTRLGSASMPRSGSRLGSPVRGNSLSWLDFSPELTRLDSALPPRSSSPSLPEFDMRNMNQLLGVNVPPQRSSSPKDVQIPPNLGDPNVNLAQVPDSEARKVPVPRYLKNTPPGTRGSSPTPNQTSRWKDEQGKRKSTMANWSRAMSFSPPPEGQGVQMVQTGPSKVRMQAHYAFLGGSSIPPGKDISKSHTVSSDKSVDVSIRTNGGSQRARAVGKHIKAHVIVNDGYVKLKGGGQDIEVKNGEKGFASESELNAEASGDTSMILAASSKPFGPELGWADRWHQKP